MKKIISLLLIFCVVCSIFFSFTCVVKVNAAPTNSARLDIDKYQEDGLLEFHPDIILDTDTLKQGVYWGTDSKVSMDGDYDVSLEGVVTTGGSFAYIDFIQSVQNLKVEDNHGSLNIESTFNLSDGVNFATSIIMFMGVDGDDKYSNIIKVYEYTGNNSDKAGFLGCDFNKKDNMFYYYYLFANRVGISDDNLRVIVFRSKYLMVPNFEFINFDRSSAEDVKNSIFESAASLLSNILIDGDTNIINAVAAGSADLSEYSDRIDVIKQFIGWNSDLNAFQVGAQYKLSIAYSNDFSKINEFKVEPDYSLCGVSHSIPLNNKDFVSFGNTGMLEPKTAANGVSVCIPEGTVVGVIDVGCKSQGNCDVRSNVAHDYVKFATDVVNGIATYSAADTVNDIGNVAEKFTECQVIYGILTTYADILEDAVEAQARWLYDQSADMTTFEKVSASASAFDVMQAVVRNNVQSIADSSGSWVGRYNIGPYENVVFSTDGTSVSTELNPTTSLISIWNELNEYQRAVLSTAYRSKINEMPSTFKASSSPCLMQWVYNYHDTSFDLGLSFQVDIDTIKSRVKEYSESGLINTGLVTNVARNCGVLSMYTVATALYTNSQDIDSIYGIYNDKLDSLVASVWSYDNFDDGHFSELPRKIGLFGDQSVSYKAMLEADANWNRFVALLYNVSYAFEVCAWSEYGEGAGYRPEDLHRWFTSDSSGADEAFAWMKSVQSWDAYTASSIDTLPIAGDEVSIDMLRCIIELHDMCEFLGINEGDWSETIDLYLNIYDTHPQFFELLRNSKFLYERAASGDASKDEPLGMFFNLNGKSMTDQWIKGFALSALYVPMETNLYDASSVTFINDSEWVSEFFYKYAFFRKALYINTDNSAIVNKFSSGTSSGTRVATLRDLLNYDRDIILTVDDNFYNANKIDTVISRLDYTAIRNTDGAADTATGGQSVSNYIGGLMDLDAGRVLKTGADVYYSDTLANKVSSLDQAPTGLYDSFLLTPDEILGSSDGKTQSVLDSYEYSVKMSYGVVSAIYRSDALFNECLRAIVSDNAIFKSSKAICSTPGTSSSDWRSVYNYYMLANLEEQMKNDCASTLDLDAPIFTDIFGNIVTESGLVIIPAACNATLCGTNWTPYTVGWSEYYNNGNRITVNDFNEDVYEWLLGTKFNESVAGNEPQNFTDVVDVKKENAGGYFWVSNGSLILRTTDLTSNNLTGTVQFDQMNKNSTVVKQLFFNDSYYNKGRKMYGHTLTNLVVETLRGAPIEYIDYEYEGLSGNMSISKYGVYMAYKLEELVNTLISGTNGNGLGGNSVVTMPNLAFVSGIEYIMLYVFKIVFAVMIVGFAVSLYLDAVRNSLGIKSVLKFVATCVLSIVAMTLVPNLVSWTYYNANKSMLSEEAGRIMMLNYVKEYDGSEIGITSVTTPETNTELYIKVNDVSVPWWDIIPEVLFGDTFATVTDLYKDRLKEDVMAITPGVVLKGDGLYVDVQDIFDSSDIQFTPSSNMLQHFVRTSSESIVRVENKVIEKDPVTGEDKEVTKVEYYNIGDSSRDVVSFVSPYYVILEQLVANVNEYNVSRDVTAYSWSVGSNGHILTYDILTPYLTSPEFLDEGFDILGLENIARLSTPKINYNFAFDDSDIDRMVLSQWYPDRVLLTESFKQSKIDSVYEYARNFVINNYDVLGKVPDEVFLKVMAMQIAIEFNKEFNISAGNAIEIINVDTRDLMRFMVSPHGDMYKYYSYSFARYVYEESGTIGVVFSALLIVVLWATSFLKPLAMLVILGLLVINVIFRKVLFRKESKCVEGYLIGCACLCLCNYAYALMLKVSMSIADVGLGSVTALVVALLVQILYVIGLVSIMAIEVRDWKNNGFHEFATISSSIQSSIVHARNVVADKIMSRTNESYRDASGSRRYQSDRYDAESIDAMMDRDREREENGSYSPN